MLIDWLKKLRDDLCLSFHSVLFLNSCLLLPLILHKDTSEFLHCP
jgi:hypothetical protein